MTKLFIAQVRKGDGTGPLVTVRAEAEGEARLFLASGYAAAAVPEPADGPAAGPGSAAA
jgi:hypothetical protein